MKQYHVVGNVRNFLSGFLLAMNNNDNNDNKSMNNNDKLMKIKILIIMIN